MDIDFATYEQSMILRELGFDRPCMGYFLRGNFIPCDTFDTKEGGGFVPFDPKLNFKNKDIIARPLYQQAFRWINDELRKFKKDFDVNSSNFFVNFEVPQDSLDKLINLLLNLKQSKSLGEEYKDVIVTPDNLDDKTTVEDFSSKINIINELSERLKRLNDENISLKAKIRSYAKNYDEIKKQREKKQDESEYLNEEVVNLISKNKKNILEIEKLKNSFLSINKIKEKLEVDLQSKKEEIEILKEKLEVDLQSKTEEIEILEEKINILEENLYHSKTQIIELEKKTKKRRFLWFFCV
jgi:hypothetical protein